MKFVFALLVLAAYGSAVTVNSATVGKKGVDFKLEVERDNQEVAAKKVAISNEVEYIRCQPMESLAYQESRIEELDKELEAFKKAQLKENENNKSNIKQYIIIQKLKVFTMDLIIPVTGLVFVALIDLLILQLFTYYPKNQKNKSYSFYFYTTALLMVIIHVFFVFFFYKFTRIIQEYCS